MLCANVAKSVSSLFVSELKLAPLNGQLTHSCMIPATKQFESSLKGKQHMTDLSAVLVQLKRERDKLDRAIAALSGAGGGTSGGKRVKRRLSPAARKRIADAQRARWAKFKARAKKAA